jgi:hypothetical protein
VRWWGWAGGGRRVEDGQVLGEAIGKKVPSLPGQATAVQIHLVPSRPAGRALLWLAGVSFGDPPIVMMLHDDGAFAVYGAESLRAVLQNLFGSN